MLKSRSRFETARDHNQEREAAAQRTDRERSVKKAIGIIHQVDPRNTGSLIVTVWMEQPNNSGRRLWGNGREIVIADSPTDLLLRFGGIRPGMVVEVFWRGSAETGRVTAHVIGEDDEVGALSRGNAIPVRGTGTTSVIPFEPGGFGI